MLCKKKWDDAMQKMLFRIEIVVEAFLSYSAIRPGLRPVNTAYPPKSYSPTEIESLPVQIIGVVVELRRKIK